MKNIYAALLIIIIGSHHCNAVQQKNVVDRIKISLSKNILRTKRNKNIALGVVCIGAAGAGAGTIGLIYYLQDAWKKKKKTQQDEREDMPESNTQSTESDHSSEQLGYEEIMSDNEEGEDVQPDPTKSQAQQLCDDLNIFFNARLSKKIITKSTVCFFFEVNIINHEIKVHFYGDAKVFGKKEKNFVKNGYKRILQDWAQSKKDENITSAHFYFHDFKGETLKGSVLPEDTRKPKFEFSL